PPFYIEDAVGRAADYRRENPAAGWECAASRIGIGAQIVPMHEHGSVQDRCGQTVINVRSITAHELQVAIAAKIGLGIRLSVKRYREREVNGRYTVVGM